MNADAPTFKPNAKPFTPSSKPFQPHAQSQAQTQAQSTQGQTGISNSNQPYSSNSMTYGQKPYYPNNYYPNTYGQQNMNYNQQYPYQYGKTQYYQNYQNYPNVQGYDSNYKNNYKPYQSKAYDPQAQSYQKPYQSANFNQPQQPKPENTPKEPEKAKEVEKTETQNNEAPSVSAPESKTQEETKKTVEEKKVSAAPFFVNPSNASVPLNPAAMNPHYNMNMMASGYNPSLTPSMIKSLTSFNPNAKPSSSLKPTSKVFVPKSKVVASNSSTDLATSSSGTGAQLVAQQKPTFTTEAAGQTKATPAVAAQAIKENPVVVAPTQVSQASAPAAQISGRNEPETTTVQQSKGTAPKMTSQGVQMAPNALPFKPTFNPQKLQQIKTQDQAALAATAQQAVVQQPAVQPAMAVIPQVTESPQNIAPAPQAKRKKKLGLMKVVDVEPVKPESPKETPEQKEAREREELKKMLPISPNDELVYDLDMILKLKTFAPCKILLDPIKEIVDRETKREDVKVKKGYNRNSMRQGKKKHNDYTVNSGGVVKRREMTEEEKKITDQAKNIMDKVKKTGPMADIMYDLNRLTPDNYENLKLQLKEKMKWMNDLVAALFKKSWSEPKYAQLYANLSNYLISEECKEKNIKKTKCEFRLHIIQECENTFRKRNEDNEKLKDLEGEDLYEALSKEKKKLKGTMNFIGELLVNGILDLKVLNFISEDLLYSEKERGRENDVEAFCTLLTCCGEWLEKQVKNTQKKKKKKVIKTLKGSVELKDMVEDMFIKLDKIATDPTYKLDMRVKLLVKNVLDLREKNWEVRSKKEGPKMIKNIHEDFEQEREKEQIIVDNYYAGRSSTHYHKPQPQKYTQVYQKKESSSPTHIPKPQTQDKPENKFNFLTVEENKAGEKPEEEYDENAIIEDDQLEEIKIKWKSIVEKYLKSAEGKFDNKKINGIKLSSQQKIGSLFAFFEQFSDDKVPDLAIFIPKFLSELCSKLLKPQAAVQGLNFYLQTIFENTASDVPNYVEMMPKIVSQCIQKRVFSFEDVDMFGLAKDKSKNEDEDDFYEARSLLMIDILNELHTNHVVPQSSLQSYWEKYGLWVGKKLEESEYCTTDAFKARTEEAIFLKQDDETFLRESSSELTYKNYLEKLRDVKTVTVLDFEKDYQKLLPPKENWDQDFFKKLGSELTSFCLQLENNKLTDTTAELEILYVGINIFLNFAKANLERKRDFFQGMVSSIVASGQEDLAIEQFLKAIYQMYFEEESEKSDFLQSIDFGNLSSYFRRSERKVSRETTKPEHSQINFVKQNYQWYYFHNIQLV
eukprot:TRINITY_DN550_c0_g1_i7.p1 TRINITY_DN550_c0_g1~~TRINITY_DN550_c0_g1_i7.p1  ORF type:complete len:1305 (-),score=224.28 TRINITY_DN550_c0_g1_i7:22-3936(-)